jgi:hypothetical protein
MMSASGGEGQSMDRIGLTVERAQTTENGTSVQTDDAGSRAYTLYISIVAIPMASRLT